MTPLRARADLMYYRRQLGIASGVRSRHRWTCEACRQGHGAPCERAELYAARLQALEAVVGGLNVLLGLQIVAPEP